MRICFKGEPCKVGLLVGLDDFGGLFQPECCSDSVKKLNSFPCQKKSVLLVLAGLPQRESLQCYNLTTNRGYSKWAMQLRKKVKDTFYKATKVRAVETHGTLKELFNALAGYKT